MKVFNDVEIQAMDGETYTIAANNVLPLIAEIEDIITLPDLIKSSQGEMPKLAKIALAYAKILRFAGCNCSAESVYSDLFVGENNKNAAEEAVTALLMLMIPPEHLHLDDLDVPEEEQKKGKKKKKDQ